MRNPIAKLMGMNMMTVTARSMAGTVKYLGWSPRFQHPENLTTKLLGWRPNTQLMRNPNQANGDEPHDVHSQVSRRNSQRYWVGNPKPN